MTRGEERLGIVNEMLLKDFAIEVTGIDPNSFHGASQEML